MAELALLRSVRQVSFRWPMPPSMPVERGEADDDHEELSHSSQNLAIFCSTTSQNYFN